VLFTLLAERYERRSVILTTNLAFSAWERIFKDPMTTLAAIDRVVHHAVILDMMGLVSYRAKEAHAQHAPPTEPPTPALVPADRDPQCSLSSVTFLVDIHHVVAVNQRHWYSEYSSHMATDRLNSMDVHHCLPVRTGALSVPLLQAGEEVNNGYARDTDRA